MKLQFKQLHPDAQLPTRGSKHAAGFDLYSVEHVELHPGTRRAVSTGVSVSIPAGFYGRIAPRSGLAVKSGVDVLAGVVDPDYRGEIKVVLINLDFNLLNTTIPLLRSITAGTPCVINPGDRIAQLIIEYIAAPIVEWVNELPDTARGAGGFGSSGS